LGIALGLGLLVGLQREQVSTQLAGLRTFALITVLGTICGLISLRFGGWIVAAGFLALTGVLMTGHVAELKGEKTETGVTTEVAALAMFGLGAYIVEGYREVAIVVGGGVAVLLHFKGELHGIAARLGEDSKAIMQFALISMVVLPVLPNKTYGRYAVLNPRQIWLMVVLIVGIGLGGYIAYKFFGESVGLLLAGLLGGIISSTATTVSYSKRTAKAEVGDQEAAIVILFSSVVSCALVLVEVAIVAPVFFHVAVLPVSIVIGTLAVASSPLWFRRRRCRTEMSSQGNPSELKAALQFGLLYTLILLAIAAVKNEFGGRALYGVAAVAGVAEVHAIALSTSQLVESMRLNSADGWQIIVIALISSLVFKLATAALVGSRQLLRIIVLPYLVTIAAGIGIVTWWCW
jgi:uncharacterized membrane protein (DUF4010 family)